MLEMSNTNSGVGLVQALEAAERKPVFTNTSTCSTIAASTTNDSVFQIPEIGETVETATSPNIRLTPIVMQPSQTLPVKVTALARKPLKGNATGIHMRPTSTTPPSGVIKLASQPIVKSCVYHVYPANNGFKIGNPTILVPATITTVTTTPVQSFIITTPSKQKILESRVMAPIPKCFSCGRNSSNSKTCDLCGKMQPMNPACPSGSADAANQKIPLGAVMQKKRFYGKPQLTPLLTLSGANGHVIKRNIVRRPAKRKSVDPPECLTISDDEDALDTTNDASLSEAMDTSQNQEEEAEPRTPDQIDGATNGKDSARSPVIIPLNRIKTTDVTKMITYPPPPETGGITVTTEDFNCLESGEFLNDVIIDFYLKYVMLEKLSEEDKNRTHIFSSFFYGRLAKTDMPIHSPSSSNDADSSKGTLIPIGTRRHNRVKTWTRHVDIFSKDFIIIPINESAHWFLAIICYPYLNEEDSEPCAPKTPVPAQSVDANQNGSSSENTNAAETKVCSTGDVKRRKFSNSQKKPCIIIFDSLHGRNWSKITAVLREYLSCEWKSKKNSDRQFTRFNIKGICPIVPQQSNFSDCGAYLLQYVDSFFENPIKDFAFPVRHLQNWFSDTVVGNKRQDLKDLILRLQTLQNQTSEAAKADAGTVGSAAAAPTSSSSSSSSSVVSVPQSNSPRATATSTPAKPVANCLKELASNYDSVRSPSPPAESDSVGAGDVTTATSQNGCSGVATSDLDTLNRSDDGVVGGSNVSTIGGIESAAARELDFLSEGASGVDDVASFR